MKKNIFILLLFCSCREQKIEPKFPSCPQDGQVIEFENVSADEVGNMFVAAYLHEGETGCNKRYDPGRGYEILDDTIPEFWRFEFKAGKDTSIWQRLPIQYGVKLILKNEYDY